MKPEYKVIFFEKENGSIPAEEFLKKLDKKIRAKMDISITALQAIGPKLRMPYSEHLSDGIFELRAKSGTDICRVLYFFMIGKRAVLTHGFVKKTQKTPRSEIERAKEYRKIYLESVEINNENL